MVQNIKDTFDDEENLYRAVYPNNMFWRTDGTVTSAAFKSNNGGCSVERSYNRDENQIINTMKNEFTGSIVSVKVKHCKNVSAYVKYKPSTRSKYHSEICGSKEVDSLSAGQRKKIAKNAVVVYKEEIKE